MQLKAFRENKICFFVVSIFYPLFSFYHFFSSVYKAAYIMLFTKKRKSHVWMHACKDEFMDIVMPCMQNICSYFFKWSWFHLSLCMLLLCFSFVEMWALSEMLSYIFLPFLFYKCFIITFCSSAFVLCCANKQVHIFSTCIM